MGSPAVVVLVALVVRCAGCAPSLPSRAPTVDAAPADSASTRSSRPPSSTPEQPDRRSSRTRRRSRPPSRDDHPGAGRRGWSASWRPGCPVPLEDLRYVTVTHRDFDGARPAGRAGGARGRGRGRGHGVPRAVRRRATRSGRCGWSTTSARATTTRWPRTTRRRSTAGRSRAARDGRSTRTAGRSTSTRWRTRTCAGSSVAPYAGRAFADRPDAAGRHPRRRRGGPRVRGRRLAVGRRLGLADRLPALLPVGTLRRQPSSRASTSAIRRSAIEPDGLRAQRRGGVELQRRARQPPLGRAPRPARAPGAGS